MTGYVIWLRQVQQAVLHRTSLLYLRQLRLEGEMKTRALVPLILQFGTLYECINQAAFDRSTRSLHVPLGAFVPPPVIPGFLLYSSDFPENSCFCKMALRVEVRRNGSPQVNVSGPVSCQASKSGSARTR